MFSITLICVGKLKEKFYLSAAAEYQKRLSGLCAFQLIELPEVRLSENPSEAEIAQGLKERPTPSASKFRKEAGSAPWPLRERRSRQRRLQKRLPV